MSSKPNLEGYVDVAERLKKFHERYPEGSLQGDYELTHVGESLFLIYRAEAYRTPDDPRPGIGYAWEPVPGLTPYTRGSELMVGETSAWGRALAALGFEVHRGIASAQEVANRSEDGPPREASAKQKRAITTTLNKAGVARDFQREIVHKLAGDPPSAKGASEILDVLFDDVATPQMKVATLLERAELEWPSDVPGDETDLPEVVEDDGTTISA